MSTDTIPQAFWRGLTETLAGNDNGITYDDDPTSPRSEAYDRGKNVAEQLQGMQDGGTMISNMIVTAPEMLADLRRFVDYYATKSTQLGNGEARQHYDRARALLARIEPNITLTPTRTADEIIYGRKTD